LFRLPEGAQLSDEQILAVQLATRAAMGRFQEILDGVALEQLRRGAARPEEDTLLTAPAVAAKLGVSVSWVRRQSRGTGRLARIVKNVGGTRRYGAAQLDKWIARQRGDES
jgi:helix-turn-helix protein